MLNSNQFSRDFVNLGGVPPPDNIITLMGQILADNDIGVEKYINKYMKRFLHNRIGTYLKENEVANIRTDDISNFNKGQLLVYEDGSHTYKFVLFLTTNSDNTSTIVTKNSHDDTDYIESNVPTGSLVNYSKSEPIQQNYKPTEVNLSEEELLETYIL